jgi:hypothetical protein
MSHGPHPTRDREAFLADAARRLAELEARVEALGEASAPVVYPTWPGLVVFGITVLLGVGAVVWMALRDVPTEAASTTETPTTTVESTPSPPDAVPDPRPEPVVESAARTENDSPAPMRAPATVVASDVKRASVNDLTTGGGGVAGVVGEPPVKTVHWSEVKIKTRATVRPDDYPAAAVALNLPEQRCVVRITIDEQGVPVSATPKACPDVFYEAATTVAMRFRFYPLEENGRATKGNFDLALNFKPPD